MFKQLSSVNILLLNNINAISTRGLSAVTASITRTRRAIAPRTYPTVLVLPDGASINIRYHEPRKIIKVYKINFKCTYPIKLSIAFKLLNFSCR